MARDPEITRRIMSAVKSANTAPEMALRRALHARGLRYRVNVKNLPGKPDVCFTRARLAVFCDGDYWHGHNWALRGLASLEEELSRYPRYWRDKISANVRRDRESEARLEASGWTVLRFWASEINADARKCADLTLARYKEAMAQRPLGAPKERPRRPRK
ncbi:MAG: very short patch repair endonuclease [Deltaproteobacteria bacterium]|jgi:DNA mismatch endonuclease (patch repair protein)|nr:very short patch repair endonuclease [Deltaproteobacteria bacterium]